MHASRFLVRALRSSGPISKPATRLISTSSTRLAEHKDRFPSNVEEYRELMKSKANVPHMTNTTSAESQEMPAVGADKAPPEFITSVDPNFVPKDHKPENTERMTGKTQEANPDKASVRKGDLSVGEVEGISFKVEPLRRTGEDPTTMRARLLCPLSPISFFERSKAAMRQYAHPLHLFKD